MTSISSYTLLKLAVCQWYPRITVEMIGVNEFFGEFVVWCLELKVASRCTHELASAHGELKG